MTPEERNQVLLVVDGQTFAGWEEIDIERSIEQMAGRFHVQGTLRWDGREEPFLLREGLACQVKIGPDVVITGYIDDFGGEFDADSAVITLEGRDKTGDLVDCSAIHKTGQWHGAGLLQIVKDICQPFGIGVVVEQDLDLGDPFPSFALEEGETAFCAIDRACRMRAVLCTSTPAGEVLLTQASEDDSGVQLIEGVNMKVFSSQHTWRERYSQVIVKGQTQGTDDYNGTVVAHAQAQAKDAEINRYRPLVVVAEHGAPGGSLQDRADWEVRVRMGRGKRGRVQVVGWRVADEGRAGRLWQDNTLVSVDSPRMQLAQQDMLIVSVKYHKSDKRGTVTDLVLARREAYEVTEGVKRGKLNRRFKARSDAHKKKGKKRGYNSSFDVDVPPTREGS